MKSIRDLLMKFYDDDDDINEICQNQSNLDLDFNF